MREWRACLALWAVASCILVSPCLAALGTDQQSFSESDEDLSQLLADELDSESNDQSTDEASLDRLLVESDGEGDSKLLDDDSEQSSDDTELENESKVESSLVDGDLDSDSAIADDGMQLEDDPEMTPSLSNNAGEKDEDDSRLLDDDSERNSDNTELDGDTKVESLLMDGDSDSAIVDDGMQLEDDSEMTSSLSDDGVEEDEEGKEEDSDLARILADDEISNERLNELIDAQIQKDEEKLQRQKELLHMQEAGQLLKDTEAADGAAQADGKATDVLQSDDEQTKESVGDTAEHDEVEEDALLLQNTEDNDVGSDSSDSLISGTEDKSEAFKPLGGGTWSGGNNPTDAPVEWSTSYRPSTRRRRRRRRRSSSWKK